VALAVAHEKTGSKTQWCVVSGGGEGQLGQEAAMLSAIVFVIPVVVVGAK